MSDARSITVKVLGRDYQVACPPDERDALYAAARYLDDRMISIRKRAAGLGLERIAIMTALNMARELMAYERGENGTPAASPAVVTKAPSSAARKSAGTA
ncbi:MAG: cell division protein ZapA, partial [Oceanococcaceae bacterium]